VERSVWRWRAAQAPGQLSPGAAAMQLAIHGRSASASSSLPPSPPPSPPGWREKTRRSPDRSDRELPYQDQVRAFYQSSPVQMGIACVIIANFIASICERQIDPYPHPFKLHPTLWANLDDTFNTIFILELLINLYGLWFYAFWRDGWNVFDTVVVGVGVCTIARADLGPFNDLKMMRAFRVFRLFKRVKSLHAIVVNLVQSVPGVLSAFALTLIVMSVYAILAVEWFREVGWNDEETYVTLYDTKQINVSVYEPRNATATTLRRIPYGEEYYGTFLRALYTLFQVMTGESWCENVVRPLLFGFNAPHAAVPAIFFGSFVVLTQIVLANVIIAVLLDSFCASAPEAPSASTGNTGRLSAEATRRCQPKVDALQAHVAHIGGELRGVRESMQRLLAALEEAASDAATAAGEDEPSHGKSSTPSRHASRPFSGDEPLTPQEDKLNESSPPRGRQAQGMSKRNRSGSPTPVVC